MSYDNLLIMHSFFVGVLKNVNKKDEKKKYNFPLVLLAAWTGTGTGKWSCEHAQFDNFAFSQETFPFRLESKLNWVQAFWKLN